MPKASMPAKKAVVPVCMQEPTPLKFVTEVFGLFNQKTNHARAQELVAIGVRMSPADRKTLMSILGQLRGRK